MASTFRDRLEIPKRYNNWSLGLMAVGLVSVIILFFTHGISSDQRVSSRFWAALLQNSVYFLLVVNACMFFICATTLAWGSWAMTFRRVTEAITTAVPVIGVITFVILMVLVWGPNHVLYQWAD
ncbi:MAG: quinol:cytochrome C oxidoreductase, partial [Flavisolibacter sp.]